LLVHETLRGRSETEVRSFLLHPEYTRIQKRLGEKLRGRLTRASDAMLRGVLIGLGA
jgi:hypothetical protein